MGVQKKASPTEPKKAEAIDDQFSEQERAYIDAELRAAEESVRKHGWVEKTVEEMLADFKAEARKNGKL